MPFFVERAAHLDDAVRPAKNSTHRYLERMIKS